MALNYGHNYKMSWIFGERERINRVQDEEQKPLLSHSLFLYQSVPSTSRPQLLLVLLEIGGRLLGCWEKGNVTAALVIIKGSGYLGGIQIYTVCWRAEELFFRLSFISNIDITAPSLLKMKWPIIIQILDSSTKILLHAKLLLFQRIGT